MVRLRSELYFVKYILPVNTSFGARLGARRDGALLLRRGVSCVSCGCARAPTVGGDEENSGDVLPVRPVELVSAVLPLANTDHDESICQALHCSRRLVVIVCTITRSCCYMLRFLFRVCIGAAQKSLARACCSIVCARAGTSNFSPSWRHSGHHGSWIPIIAGLCVRTFTACYTRVGEFCVSWRFCACGLA